MSIVKNVPLLQKALDHIEAHPEEWDQHHWGLKTSCGTVACLAGHITLADGWTPVLDEDSTDDYGNRAWAGIFKEGEDHRYVDPATQQPYETVEQVALDVLGIDLTDWSMWIGSGNGYLFGGQHDREDVWRIANAMTGGQLTLPFDLQEEPVAGF